MDDIKKIGVIGMGYVGLTLSIVLAGKGYNIIGSECNNPVREQLKKGKPHFFEHGLERSLRYSLESDGLKLTKSINTKCDAYIICVASPIDKYKKPNTEAVERASNELIRYLKEDPLIVVRSTVPLGTTRNKILPILESSGKKCGKNFSLVFAPERTLEGDALQELYRNPQIIGGYDERSTERASGLFRKITPSIIEVSSLEAAEAAKLLDNTSRDIKFAFSNLFSQLCEDNSLDAYEIIDAANRFYSRNDIPFPSPGVGGVCLTKDPRLLVYSSPNTENINLILGFRELNENYPSRIVGRIKQSLEDISINKKMENCNFFLSGFSFKGQPEIDDIRDSTSFLFLNELKKYTSNIKAYDPIIDKKILRDFGLKVVDNYEQGFQNIDCAFFLNNHKSYSDLDIIYLSEKMKKPAIIFDSWRMLDQNIKKVKGIKYMGVGL